jgi:hypothetical protein
MARVRNHVYYRINDATALDEAMTRRTPPRVEQYAGLLRNVVHSLHTLREPFAAVPSGPRLDSILRDASPELIEALRWANEHPEYRFAKLLPGLSFRSSQIHRFLVNVLTTWEERWSSPYR